MNIFPLITILLVFSNIACRSHVKSSANFNANVNVIKQPPQTHQAVFNISNFPTNKYGIPKVVWQYFDKGIDHSDDFTKIFNSHNLKVIANSGWSIISVDDQSLKKYIEVGVIDEFFEQIPGKKFIQTKSDLIRLMLVGQYGGLWMDASNYLIQNLNWLEELDTNPDLTKNRIQPKDARPHVFVFTCSLHDYQRKDRSRFMARFQGINILPEYQSWFIAAIPQAEFILDWFRVIKQQSSLAPFQLRNKLLSEGVQLNQYQSITFYYRVFTSKATVMAKKQMELDKKWQTGELKLPQRPLALEYYKIWTMQSSVGPLLNEATALFIDQFKLFNLMRYPLQQIYTFRQPRYLIKVPGYVRKVVVATAYPSDETTRQNIYNQNMFSRYIYNFTGQWKCLSQYYIIKGSLVYFLLTENGTNHLNDFKYYSQEEIPFICRSFIAEEVILFAFVFLILTFIFSLALYRQYQFLKLHQNQTKAQNQLENDHQSQHLHLKQQNGVNENIIQNKNLQKSIKLTKEENEEETQAKVTTAQIKSNQSYFTDWMFISLPILCQFCSTCLIMQFLKEINIFLYAQVSVILILLCLSNEYFNRAFKQNASLKKIWLCRLSILLVLIMWSYAINLMNKHFSLPNTSGVSQMLVGCLVLKHFLSKNMIGYLIWFSLMEELILRRSYVRLFKSIINGKQLNLK